MHIKFEKQYLKHASSLASQNILSVSPTSPKYTLDSLPHLLYTL